MRSYLIGLDGSGARHRREPDPGFFLDPVEHLDVIGTVLGSHRNQQKAVEQFWLPQDEEYLQQVWTAYHRLLGKVFSLRADREASLERSTKMPAPVVLEVNKLKEQLEEALRAKARAEVLAKAEKEEIAHARLAKITDAEVSIERVAELISGLESSHRPGKGLAGSAGRKVAEAMLSVVHVGPCLAKEELSEDEKFTPQPSSDRELSF
ncbi:uncharacterized protein A4U43_C01F23150 [Asparagus officinalis]|uniref:Uncharacterized protein n=1 Tax=Asparagus officinalis TaxID=4686 RepID=A0A5P1FTB9_ASPOF|nr:uncharacterized protein A4U43_C01F23150 [Asparagus officinalis]